LRYVSFTLHRVERFELLGNSNLNLKITGVGSTVVYIICFIRNNTRQRKKHTKDRETETDGERDKYQT